MRESCLYQGSHMSHFPIPISFQKSSPICQGRWSITSLTIYLIEESLYDHMVLTNGIPHQLPQNMYCLISYLAETDANHQLRILTHSPFQSVRLPLRHGFLPRGYISQTPGKSDVVIKLGSGSWNVRESDVHLLPGLAPENLPGVSHFCVFFPSHSLEWKCFPGQPQKSHVVNGSILECGGSSYRPSPHSSQKQEKCLLCLSDVHFQVYVTAVNLT